MSTTTNTKFAVVSAPGFGHGNAATVASTHKTLVAAKRACNDRCYAIVEVSAQVTRGDRMWRDGLRYVQVGRV